jgi:hypothetical protein
VAAARAGVLVMAPANIPVARSAGQAEQAGAGPGDDSPDDDRDQGQLCKARAFTRKRGKKASTGANADTVDKENQAEGPDAIGNRVPEVAGEQGREEDAGTAQIDALDLDPAQQEATRDNAEKGDQGLVDQQLMEGLKVHLDTGDSVCGTGQATVFCACGS